MKYFLGKTVTNKILLTSDESFFRLMVSQFLKVRGLQVTTAINGLDAIHKCEKETFHMVVAESKMQVLDGLGMLGQLSEMPNWENFHVIILLDEDAPEDTVIESDFVHILKRPFSLEKLYTRITNTLSSLKKEIHEPTQEEDELLMSEDAVYLGMMRDILHENSCMAQLIEFVHNIETFNSRDELGTKFYELTDTALGSSIRLWMLRDGKPVPLAENPRFSPLPFDSPVYDFIEKSFEDRHYHTVLPDRQLFYYDEFVMEVMEYPAYRKHITQLLKLFMKNFIPLFHSFRDRAYFRQLKEQFLFANHLKDLIVENLEEVRVKTNMLSDDIGEEMDRILLLSSQMHGDEEITDRIEEVAQSAMNRIQYSDINNQKLFSVIGNIENMFHTMQESLECKDEFFSRSKFVDLQEVASESIMDKSKQSDQNDIDHLLSDMGL